MGVDTLRRQVEDGSPKRQHSRSAKASNDTITCQSATVQFPVIRPLSRPKQLQSSESSKWAVPVKAANCSVDQELTYLCGIFVDNLPCGKDFQRKIDLEEHFDDVSVSDR